MFTLNSGTQYKIKFVFGVPAETSLLFNVKFKLDYITKLNMCFYGVCNKQIWLVWAVTLIDRYEHRRAPPRGAL